MPELTEFLLARIAEDEALAQAVAETHSAVQSVETDTPTDPNGPQWARDTRTFVNTWDPARVLAESEAKRLLVTELARMQDEEMGWDGIEYKVMTYLALPYADR